MLVRANDLVYNVVTVLPRATFMISIKKTVESLKTKFQKLHVIRVDRTTSTFSEGLTLEIRTRLIVDERV